MEKKQEELEFLVFERITNPRVKGHSGSTPEDTLPTRDRAQPRPSRAGRAPLYLQAGVAAGTSAPSRRLPGPHEGQKKHSL